MGLNHNSFACETYLKIKVFWKHILNIVYLGFCASLAGFWLVFYGMERYKVWAGGVIIILGLAITVYDKVDQLMEMLPFLAGAGLCHVGIGFVCSDRRNTGFSLVSVGLCLVFYFKPF